jgi:hypothetical protein
MPFDLSSAVPVTTAPNPFADQPPAGGAPAGAAPAAAVAAAGAQAAPQAVAQPVAQPAGAGGFDLSSAVPVTAATQPTEPGNAASPGWWQRLQLPEQDPNSVENTIRRTLGAPAVGANPEFEKVANADSPFPDVMPVAPNALKNLASAAGSGIKYLLRGGEANIPKVAANIDAAAKAGTALSVGQTTGNRAVQAAESFLSKYPGSAGVMAKKGAAEASEIGSQVEKIADDLSPNATPFVAGRTIEKGLSGPGGFVDRFKQGMSHLYDQLDPFFRYSDGSSKAVKLPNTLDALKKLNPSIPGAPETSKFFKNAKLQGVTDAIESDVGSKQAFGERPNIKASNEMVKPAFRPADLQDMFEKAGGDNLPYEAVKKIRTLVGEQLEGSGLASDVPRSKWKSLYAALSKDLDSAAIATGDPAAAKAMQRANAFTRAGHQRIDGILDKIAKQDIPERLFNSAVNAEDMRSGATKVGTIMKSLTQGERDVVKSAFIRRMGTAAAGQQGAEGGAFSSQTFLTNWNKMSQQAKDVMFSSKDGNLRGALDAIAKTAENIKEGGKVFANPSGSGQIVAASSLASGIAGAATSGRLGAAATLLGTVPAANLTAKLLTNPRFVGWLARASKSAGPDLARQAVISLGKTMQGEPDDVQQDAQDYARAVAGGSTVPQ